MEHLPRSLFFSYERGTKIPSNQAKYFLSYSFSSSIHMQITSKRRITVREKLLSSSLAVEIQLMFYKYFLLLNTHQMV